jgi:hypothetical protein
MTLVPNLLPAVIMGTAMISLMTWLAVLLLKDAHNERRERRERKDEYQEMHDSLLRHVDMLEEIMDKG